MNRDEIGPIIGFLLVAFVLFSTAAYRGWFDNDEVSKARFETKLTHTTAAAARQRFIHCNDEKENCWGAIDDDMWATSKKWSDAQSRYRKAFIDEWGYAVDITGALASLVIGEPWYLKIP
ncbi:MAG: hypothetical protein J0H44_13570 [Alphaproteobacteria bacterium]|nr:hypothetical protein [Alphaproteobacteria bacterium]